MSTTVSITANDDGSFTVEQEPGQVPTEAQEGPENGAQDAAEDQSEGEPSQQFASLSEALDAAAQMLGGGQENAPKMPGEDDFTQGFTAVRGTPTEQQAARVRR